MKITIDEEELMVLLKRSFPADWLPKGSKVTKVETIGYPVREFTVTIEKEGE